MILQFHLYSYKYHRFCLFLVHLLTAFRTKSQSTIEDLGDSVEIYIQKVIRIILQGKVENGMVDGLQSSHEKRKRK